MKLNKEEILKICRVIFIKIRPVLIVILAVVLLYYGYRAYKYFFGYHIIAEFNELGPMKQSMLVYYKGFKVGHTGKINPSKDYSTSRVRLILDRNLNHLPDNIVAKVKKFEQTDEKSEQQSYIDITYPNIPSKQFVKRGLVIEGKTAVDMQSFMSSQAESGSLTIISTNMGKTLESAEKTSDEIRALIVDFRDVLKENRTALNEISKNMAVATKGISDASTNMGEVSEKLNRSLSEEELSSIVKNLNSTTASIDGAAKNIQSVTENVEKATQNLDKTMSDVDATVGNINQITGGMRNTMSKRFGTMRFMFGTPIQDY